MQVPTIRLLNSAA